MKLLSMTTKIIIFDKKSFNRWELIVLLDVVDQTAILIRAEFVGSSQISVNPNRNTDNAKMTHYLFSKN